MLPASAALGRGPANAMNDADLIAHNASVARLWEDFSRSRNARVPITFASDEALWLKLTGHSFREFYTDARVQLEGLPAGLEWGALNPLCERGGSELRFATAFPLDSCRE